MEYAEVFVRAMKRESTVSSCMSYIHNGVSSADRVIL